MINLQVIIPTCNRHELLFELIDNLNNQDFKINKIHIIDSSDQKITTEQISSKWPIDLIHTNIKSAAKQRNIGMQQVTAECDYLAFLDDDVRINEKYFDELVETLKKSNSIGVSGLTNDSIDRLQVNHPLTKMIKTFFLLDSFSHGKVTLSGVNVPCGISEESNITEVEWLIGCALWDYSYISDLTFNSKYYGHSLGEDVLFSLQASKKGRLTVNSNVRINHLNSKINRVNESDYWYMWAKNRKNIIQELKPKNLAKVAYYWSNFGQILILLGKTSKKLKFKNVFALIKGSLK